MGDFTARFNLSFSAKRVAQQKSFRFVCYSLAKLMSDGVSNDPFEEARRKKGVMRCPFQGEAIPMILRHSDVQQAAKDWETYSSDRPFRVPIPSEEYLRTMRQLPIETNPPKHTEYRAIVEPFFKRHRDPEMIAKVEALIDSLIDMALAEDSIEAMTEFALPLQCYALTYLLNVPECEAETWIDWGIHVFVKDGGRPEEMDLTLENYLAEQFDRAGKNPGDDFYSTLMRTEYQGRPLTREEVMGFANLTFAGGRDTVIHTVTSILAHLAGTPEDLEFLRNNPKKIGNATEEFFRVVSPLTHIGRVCPEETNVLGETVAPEGRVSLCWVSANHDESVFENPEEIRLDRKPNPHIAFGAGAHFCLGAGHARLLVKTLLQKVSQRVGKIVLLEKAPHLEREQKYTRSVGYDSLRIAMHPVD